MQGLRPHRKKFNLFEIWAKSQKNWAKKFRHFLTKLVKFCLLVILSVWMKVYYVIENTLKIYKQQTVSSNFMFQCVRVDEWLTHLKLRAKKAFHVRALLNCKLQESSMLQGTYFLSLSVESIQGKYKVCVFTFKDGVWNWTHFTMQYVACMSSVRCEDHCWQQQMSCKWNTKPQNCESNAHRVLIQLASGNVLAKPSVRFFS